MEKYNINLNLNPSISVVAEYEDLLVKEEKLMDSTDGDIAWRFCQASFSVDRVADDITEFLANFEREHPGEMQHPGVCLLRSYLNAGSTKP